MTMCEKCAYYKVKNGSVRKTCCRQEIEADMAKNHVEWLESPQDLCFDVWVDHNAKMATRNGTGFSEEENQYLIRLGNTVADMFDFDVEDEEIII